MNTARQSEMKTESQGNPFCEALGQADRDRGPIELIVGSKDKKVIN